MLKKIQKSPLPHHFQENVTLVMYFSSIHFMHAINSSNYFLILFISHFLLMDDCLVSVRP